MVELIEENKKIEMTVKMEVTIPQALTLQAVFEYWNRLDVGELHQMERNFQPKIKCEFSEDIPELTKEVREATIKSHINGRIDYDLGGIGWHLRQYHEMMSKKYNEIIKMKQKQLEEQNVKNVMQEAFKLGKDLTLEQILYMIDNLRKIK